MKKIALLATFSLILIALAGCDQTNLSGKGGQGTPDLTVGEELENYQCYLVEEEVAFNLPRRDYKQGATVHYLRVFANALIGEGKVGDTTKLIKPKGQEPLPENEIHSYTQAGNWRGESMEPFLLVRLLPVEDSGVDYRGQLLFDIYIDEAEKDNLPEFVKKCDPQGGNTVILVPPAGSSQLEMPNGFFATASLDKKGFEKDFASVADKLKKYYIKIGLVPLKAEKAVQIGKITMKTSSETKTYDIFYHLEVVYLLGGGTTYQYDGTDEIPQMPGAMGKTLKLATIRFVVLNGWNWFTPECKPVIYLYPEEETSLSVWVRPRGYLTKTEPEYLNGWLNLLVNPAGRIFFRGKFYPYLHYEAMVGDFRPPEVGFIVKREDLAGFFDQILPKTGLNQKEATDFKEYWLARLNNYPFYQVLPLSREQIEEIEPIEFSKPPETFLRVRFYFKGLEVLEKMPLPQMEKPLPRKGFTAVEWGGLYDNLGSLEE